MHTIQAIVIGALVVTTAGCNPFHRAPPVEMSAADANVNTRWHGTIASPSRLAGMVQMRGSATMEPAASEGVTTVNLELSNAAPGGEHPWSLHQGACDRDRGMVGELPGFNSIRIGNDGRGESTATVKMHSPTSGAYSVWVAASPANASQVVGCANLAQPSR
jgi:hypothetical protein